MSGMNRHDESGYEAAAAARRERREATRRRSRRRRTGAVAVALVAAAGATAWGVAAATGGDDAAPRTAARHDASAATQTTASASTAAATSPAPAAPDGDGGPSPQQQAAAVKRVASVGVPVYRAGGKGKYVALTFDDGPGPYTVQTLDTLRANNARATFFVTGTSMERFPKELAAEGRRADLGNHSWSHPYYPSLAPEAVWTQVTDTNHLVTARTGQDVTLLRPPYGAHTADLRRRLHDADIAMILWDVDSQDAVGATWDSMLARLKTEIRPGSIVLMHENRGQTQKVVNRLVPWLRKNGWTMVTVPELLALDPPTEEQLRREAAGRADATTGTRYG